jgi:adenylate cyclase
MDAPRKLAAILAADVVGYSRLTELDEEGTLDRLRNLRRELINPAVAQYRGRVVKTTGDGILIEFSSVVDAVRCALDVQRGVDSQNADVTAEQRIDFRVGINVGDVVVEGDDLLGDGVNVAARLEGISEPGGICVSEAAYQQVRDKLDVSFEDAGEQHLKNIARPVRAYRLRLDHHRVQAQPSLPLPDKPSIAVLPFNVLQGGADDEAFADGLTEDIITSVSRISSLFVIARNSTFIYKGKPVEIKQVSRDLGVRYVLEGSIRHSGNRIRVTAQLIDALSANHVWAEKYDCDATDLFSTQDEVAQKVAASVQAEIRMYDDTFLNPRASNRSVAELVRLAWTAMYKLTAIGFREGRSHVEQARTIASDDPKLDQIAAVLEFHEFYLGYSSDGVQLARGRALAEKALAANPRDEYSHWILGILSAFLGQHDRGIGALSRSVEINPNFALGHGTLATVLAWAGEANQSREQNQIALRLNPRDPSNFFRYFGLSLAEFIAGEYSEAVNWARMVASQKPDWLLGHVLLIASLAMNGQSEEALAALTSCRLRFPDARISALAWLPFKRQGDYERLKEGLRKAGLPE